MCIATTESETERPGAEPASRQQEEDSETVTAPERVPEDTLSDVRPEQQEHPRGTHRLWDGSAPGAQFHPGLAVGGCD